MLKHLTHHVINDLRGHNKKPNAQIRSNFGSRSFVATRGVAAYAYLHQVWRNANTERVAMAKEGARTETLVKEPFERLAICLVENEARGGGYSGHAGVFAG
jgi:hypothetical protein